MLPGGGVQRAFARDGAFRFVFEEDKQVWGNAEEGIGYSGELEERRSGKEEKVHRGVKSPKRVIITVLRAWEISKKSQHLRP